MIADFRQYFSVDILQCQPAVTDHFAGVLQAHSPPPEAEIAVAVYILCDPAVNPLFIKGIWVVLHNVRIRQHRIKRVIIIFIHFTQE